VLADFAWRLHMQQALMVVHMVLSHTCAQPAVHVQLAYDMPEERLAAWLYM
jgi:hypothetical protein